jgi:NitT/TauT family transport system ATP-binding protein
MIIYPKGSDPVEGVVTKASAPEASGTEAVAPVLTVSHLSVSFANENGGLQAVEDLTFQVHPQEFLCVLGPSGAGKSVLLRVLAGLLAPTSGEVSLTPLEQDGAQRSDQPCVGYVSQQANLMPWRTALQNITLPLELKDVPAAQAHRQAQDLIDLIGLQGFENAWPRDLSGGMAQRVSIARALIQDPDLLLLDEPFGALDALTREHMGDELLRIWQARRKTVIMVTHSISEALLLSDRVLVFTHRPGRIELDMPIDLPRPRERDVRYTPHFTQLARLLRDAIA